MENSSPIRLVIPKLDHLDQKYWFVNPGIMTKTNYEKAFIMINSVDLTKFDLSYVLFLGIKYLVCYLELFSLDQTPLLTESIMSHLKFLLLITSKQSHSKSFLHHRYIRHALNIVEQFVQIPHCDYLERQMYLDNIEVICKMLICKTQSWIKNNDLLCAYMYRYGYSPSKTSVVYCSYIIPNERQYMNPLQHVSQRLLDKIEMRCFCKIKLSFKNLPCHYSDDFVLLEILFDPYRGNFLGFLDMLEYIVKCLSPTIFFPHCLRIIVLEDSCVYNFLTNIPHKKLVRMGKSISLTGRLEPFLEEFSASKRLYSLLEVMIDNEDFDDSLSSKSDEIQGICNLCDDSIDDEDEEEENIAKKNENNVKKYSRILKLFSRLYHERMDKIRTKPEHQASTKESNIIFMLGNNNSSVIRADEVKVDELNNSAKKAIIKDHCIEIAMYESDSITKEETPSEKNFIEIKVDEHCLDERVSQTNTSNIAEENLSKTVLNFRKSSDEVNREFSIEVEIDNSFENKFEEIIREPICHYSSEALFNHKLRVMMRCDTLEMPEDIFDPNTPEFLENLKSFHKNKAQEKNYGPEMGTGNEELIFDPDSPEFLEHLKLLYKKDLQDKKYKDLNNIVSSDMSPFGQINSTGKEIGSISNRKSSNEKRLLYSKSYSDNRSSRKLDLAPKHGTLSAKTSETHRFENNTFNSRNLGSLELIYKSSYDYSDTYWLSNNAEKLLNQRESENPNDQWHFSQPKDTDTGIDSNNWQGVFSQVSKKIYPVLSYQAMVDSSSSIKNYVKRFGPDTTKKFVQGKLFNENWRKLLYDQIEFDDSIDSINYLNCIPNKLFELVDKTTEMELNGVANVNMLKSKGIYSLLKVLTKGALNVGHFKILADGIGIDIPLLNKINQSPGYLPVWAGYLTDKSRYQPEHSLSFCICQLSYDMILLKIQHSQVINFIFQQHLKNFKRLINSSPPKIMRVFDVLQILDRLDKIHSDRMNFGENINDLINDFLGIHELIYSRNCCKYQHLTHGGIKVLYHSINLDNRLQVIEPFIRLPGDRRLKKIEQIGHALIALRGTHREILNVDQYTVDIFYDFKNGNHFGTFDMLQDMVNKSYQSSILQGHRSLICFPTGELWIFNDLDWLKVSTTYFLSRDKKLNDVMDN